MRPGQSLAPVTNGAHPGQLFAQDYEGGRLRLVEVDGPRWTPRRVADLPGAQDQVESAAFDGRWLVWVETHSYDSLDDFDIYSWDSQSGQVRRIGAAARTPDGKVVPSPFVIVAADHGAAAWTQGVAGHATQLHLYDLAGGHDRVMPSQFPLSPAIAWPWLIWPESQGFGKPAPLRMARADTAQIMPTPAGLAAVVTPTFLAGAPGQLAIVSSDYRTVSVWRSADDTVRPIFAAPEDDPPQYPVIGNRFVAWHGGEDLIAVELSTGHVIRLANHAGWVYGAGDQLILASAAPGQTTKSAHPPQMVIDIDTRSLGPTVGC